MNRTRMYASAMLIVSALLSSAATAEEGYGTVTFKVQVTGRHNVPGSHGGFRNIEKTRTFSGTARVKYFGGPPDVWASESCSGELQVADKGTYRGMSESGMVEAPYSLSGTYKVKERSSDPDSCSFSVTYDAQNNSAQISIDPGPSIIEAVERMDTVSTKTHLNPFDWSSIGQFNKNVKVTPGKSGHSGVWRTSLATTRGATLPLLCSSAPALSAGDSGSPSELRATTSNPRPCAARSQVAPRPRHYARP